MDESFRFRVAPAVVNVFASFCSRMQFGGKYIKVYTPICSQGATVNDLREAFPIPMGPPGATVSQTIPAIERFNSSLACVASLDNIASHETRVMLHWRMHILTSVSRCFSVQGSPGLKVRYRDICCLYLKSLKSKMLLACLLFRVIKEKWE